MNHHTKTLGTVKLYTGGRHLFLRTLFRLKWYSLPQDFFLLQSEPLNTDKIDRDPDSRGYQQVRVVMEMEFSGNVIVTKNVNGIID